MIHSEALVDPQTEYEDAVRKKKRDWQNCSYNKELSPTRKQTSDSEGLLEALKSCRWDSELLNMKTLHF